MVWAIAVAVAVAGGRKRLRAAADAALDGTSSSTGKDKGQLAVFGQANFPLETRNFPAWAISLVP